MKIGPPQSCFSSPSVLFSTLLLFFTPTTRTIISTRAFQSNSVFSRPRILRLVTAMSSSGTTYMDIVSKAVSESLGRSVKLEPTSGGGYSGGGGATTSAVIDPVTNEKYFVKTATGGQDMLRAEYMGVKEMSETNTIRVPKPIAFGVYEDRNQAFAVFEYLNFGGRGGSQYELGKQLAQMHRTTSQKGFGFHVDNTIGATFQPNLPWMDDWADFWDKQRLGHMLKLTYDAGYDKEKVEKLRAKTRALLNHKPAPSLVHGDLWGGNKGFVDDNGVVKPTIFDPATYFGDREVDVAMTYVFGGFNSDFYQGYEDEWPLPEGHEKRRVVYNLYHILNHEVLFGGGYLSQARGMIEQILRF